MVYLIGLGYVLAYAAMGWLLRDHALARSIFGMVGLLVPPIGVCVVILRRRAEWAGCQRLFWDTFAIGVGFWIIAKNKGLLAGSSVATTSRRCRSPSALVTRSPSRLIAAR